MQVQFLLQLLLGYIVIFPLIFTLVRELYVLSRSLVALCKEKLTVVGLISKPSRFLTEKVMQLRMM